MNVLTCVNDGGCKSSETPPFPSDDDPDFIDDVVDEDDNNGCFRYEKVSQYFRFFLFLLLLFDFIFTFKIHISQTISMRFIFFSNLCNSMYVNDSLLVNKRVQMNLT